MQFHKTTSKIQTEEFRSSFLFFFAAAPTKSNYAIFFIGGEMFAITLRSKESSRIPLLFPRDYEDPLSRVYIRPPETNAKEDAHEGASIGLFIFVPITVTRFQASAALRFSRAFVSRFLLSDEAKEGCDRNDVINYRASKPPRAFICTTLALPLAPLLIFLVETTPTLFCQTSANEIARTRPDE